MKICVALIKCHPDIQFNVVNVNDLESLPLRTEEEVKELDEEKKSKSVGKKVGKISIGTIIAFVVGKAIVSLIIPHNSSNSQSIQAKLLANQLISDVADLKKVNDKFQPLYFAFYRTEEKGSSLLSKLSDINSLCSLRLPLLDDAAATIQKLHGMDIEPKEMSQLQQLGANFNWQIQQCNLLKTLDGDLNQFYSVPGHQSSFSNQELSAKIKEDYRELSRVDSSLSATANAAGVPRPSSP
jgi:hypothetical protein